MTPEPVREDPAFYVDPIVGWRAWHLRRTAEGPALVPAVTGRGVWPARRAFVARCQPTARPAAAPRVASPHASPSLACTCGIYASDTLDSLIAPGRPFPAVPVVGTVSLWGRVIEHRIGWRAAFAYPDRLRLVCGVCLSLGEGTGIPERVVEMRTGGRGAGSKIEPLCAAHLAGRGGTGTRVLRPARDVQAELLSTYAVDLLPFETIEHVFHRVPPVRLRDAPAARVPAPPPRSVAVEPAPPVRPWLPEPATAAPVPPPLAPDDDPRPSTSSLPPAVVTPSRPPTPSLGSRVLDVAQRIVSAVLTVLFWVFMAWWGCSDMIVTVDGP